MSLNENFILTEGKTNFDDFSSDFSSQLRHGERQSGTTRNLFPDEHLHDRKPEADPARRSRFAKCPSGKHFTSLVTSRIEYTIVSLSKLNHVFSHPNRHFSRLYF